jgi:HSP20 family protein
VLTAINDNAGQMCTLSLAAARFTRDGRHGKSVGRWWQRGVWPRGSTKGSVMNTTRLPSLFATESFPFDDAFRSFMRPLVRWEPMSETPQIPIDVVETDEFYTVTAEIPGVARDDIHVEIEGRQVMITTEFKKPVLETKGPRVLCTERVYGFASRVFSLGVEIDRAKAVAKYADGVLTLTLPKFVAAHVEALKIE